jgi:malate permease and related proteins
MFLRIVAIVFPLFAIVVVGFLYGRRKGPDLSTANQVNMDIFIPALVFAALAAKSFDPMRYRTLALAGLGMVLGSGAAGWVLARALRIDARTLAPNIMFNNSGNLGLPLAVLAFGEQALPPAVLLFMISNFLHFSLGVYVLDHRARLSTLWRMPVTLAMMVGLTVSFLHLEVWPPLLTGARMLGEISVPLLLFSLGVRLANADLRAWRVGVLGAVARPVIGLALAFALIRLLGVAGQERALLIVFGALPPAVLNFVFAESYRREPDKVASIVAIGNVAALVFVPIALTIALP